MNIFSYFTIITGVLLVLSYVIGFFLIIIKFLHSKKDINLYEWLIWGAGYPFHDAFLDYVLADSSLKNDKEVKKALKLMKIWRYFIIAMLLFLLVFAVLSD